MGENVISKLSKNDLSSFYHHNAILQFHSTIMSNHVCSCPYACSYCIVCSYCITCSYRNVENMDFDYLYFVFGEDAHRSQSL